MIELVEALKYKCLRYINRQLHPFQMLVGPPGAAPMMRATCQPWLISVVSVVDRSLDKLDARLMLGFGRKARAMVGQFEN